MLCTIHRNMTHNQKILLQLKIEISWGYLTHAVLEQFLQKSYPETEYLAPQYKVQEP